MNDKLQKIYYIIGIIQRVTMIILTFAMMGAAYKIYNLSLQYGIEIKKIHQLVINIYNLIHKSWFF
jgi:uncharacterized membrane protein YdfJ with MMPL/SSD domain